MVMGSSPINFYIATKPSELNSNNVGWSGSRHSSSVRRFNSDLGYSLQTVGVIVDSSFASWAELDSFHKSVLPRRRRISHRVLKVGAGRWRSRCISDAVLRAIKRDRRPSIKG